VILFELAYLFLLYLFSILDHFFLSFDHANSRELKWGRGGCIAEDGFILAGTKDFGFHEVWRPEAGGGAFFPKDVKGMGMGGGEYLSSWVSCIDSFASCSGECKISTTNQTLSNTRLLTSRMRLYFTFEP
jgi:hypothetical protein